MATFTIEKKSINDIFIKPNQQFEIPRYQRQYAWEEENIEEFWKTIIGDDEVFLGTVIFNVQRKNSEGIIEIIDGQQRYLTIQILAAVLRDFCLEKTTNPKDEFDQAAQGVITTIIAQADDFRAFGPNVDRYNLRPGDSIKDFFLKYIQEKPAKGAHMSKEVETGKDPERERVKKAYLKFRSLFDKAIEGWSDAQSISFVEEIIKKKLGPHFFARIEIDDENLAYEIFETVNAKRVDLNVADLIKNQIFRHVLGPDDGFEDSAKQKWSQITTTLQGIKFPIKDFLSYYWDSKYGYVGTKLYRAIRNEFGSDKEKWKFFLDDLVVHAELMSVIIQGSLHDIHEIVGDWKDANAIYDSLRVLRSTKAKTWSILYLCLLRHVRTDSGEPSRIPFSIRKKWDVFAKFTFLYYQILNASGNWYFQTIWNFATELEQMIENKKGKKEIESRFNQLLTSFSGQLPSSKEEFDSGFLKLRYKTDNDAKVIIRYVLSEIESELAGKYYVGYDETLVNIEHVLPQKPKEWGLKVGEIKDFVNCIGNLLLISVPQNGSIGNKPLSDKIAHFKEHSTLKHVGVFVDKVESKEWNFAAMNSIEKDFSAIEVRGAELSQLGYKIWVTDLKKSMGH